MSPKLGVKIEGEERLKKKLGNSKKLRKPAELYLERASIQLKTNAKIFSPVDTNTLRPSWDSTLKTTKHDAFATVFNPMAYAFPLETSGFSPRKGNERARIPFFAPAIQLLQKQFKKLHAKLGSDIEKEFKKP